MFEIKIVSKGTTYICIVDDSDFEIVSKYKWHLNNGYAVTTIRSSDNKRTKLLIHRFSPDWEKYGNSAGYRRNADMVNVAQAVTCFWNGSKGTGHTVELANKKGVPIKIVNY